VQLNLGVPNSFLPNSGGKKSSSSKFLNINGLRSWQDGGKETPGKQRDRNAKFDISNVR